MLMELVRDGGPVLWLIVALGFTAFCVYVERALHLHRARIPYDDFLKGIITVLKRQSDAEALAICEDTPGPVAYIVKTAILHRHLGTEEIRSAVEDASVAEISRMERRLVVLSLVAQVAPLLGLLGTVLGMVDAVLVLMHQAPLVQVANLMDGLLRALTTTAAGLTVSIPCYVAFNLLVIKIDRIVLDMERTASEIRAFLSLPEEARREAKPAHSGSSEGNP